MTYEDLKKALAEYANKLNSGNASTADYTSIKNAINDAHGAESISNELKDELGKKAKFAWTNRDRANTASKVVEEIADKGGTVGKFAEKEIAPAAKVVGSAAESGAVRRGVKSFAPLLGVLGKAVAPAAALYGMSQGDAFAADPTGMLQTEELGKGSDLTQKPQMLQNPAMNAEMSGKNLAQNLKFPDLQKLTNSPGLAENPAIINSKMDSSVLPDAHPALPIDSTQEPTEQAKYAKLQALLNMSKQRP